VIRRCRRWHAGDRDDRRALVETDEAEPQLRWLTLFSTVRHLRYAPFDVHRMSSEDQTVHPRLGEQQVPDAGWRSAL
jgi:hypothetical protein